jgi:hypothetical protein
VIAVGAVVVRDYNVDDKAAWDAFVARSKNATFLFQRDYLDYHADRFPDASLVVLDDDGAVRALLPATRRGDALISHAGLTFGGFLTDESMTVGTMVEVFDASLSHLRSAGVEMLLYKTVPHIYHRVPAEEDAYALFLNDAQLYRRDVLSVIDYAAAVRWEARRRRGQKKAEHGGIEVRENREYDRFWPVLAANLERRYGVQPAHTLEEIELLARRFPDRIRLFGAFRDDVLEAGAVAYLSHTVCHVQYNASTDEGRNIGALDLVFARLIDTFRDSVRYFDFGISTEENGHTLNSGLVEYKQGFGARTVVHDFYRLMLTGSDS